MGGKKKRRARAQANNNNASASASAPASPPKTNRLIVGIDFGTTFSGVAWAFTNDKAVRLLRSWPSEPLLLEKIKTELVYTEKVRKNGTSYRWASEAKSVDNPLCWFKLLLHEDGHTKGSDVGDKLHRLEDTKKRIPQGKTSVDLVADYLQGLYRHFRKEISHRYPAALIEKLGSEVPVHFYLTVPAIWDSAAKEKTLQAARKAGIEEFGSLHLISEPEAAAAHCFVEYKGTESALKPNDVYVIVDCGGGTVDIISYEIVSVNPKLQVNEAVVGTGELCGAVYLDDAFIRLVKERIGDAAYNSMSEEQKSRMLKDFEFSIKRKLSFAREDESDDDEDDEDDDDDDDADDDGDDKEDDEDNFLCELPGVDDNEDAQVFAQTISISRDDVKEKIFGPILTQITQMVQEQIDKAEKNCERPVTAVVLVGGFGRSRYLRQHLEHSLMDSHGEKFGRVLEAPDAWQAIVQGAVHHGLMSEMHLSTHADNAAPREISGFVNNRLARASYGFSACEEFDPEKHKDKADKTFFNPLFMTLMVRRRMQWFIKKGDPLNTRKPKKESVTSLIPVNALPDIFRKEFKIFESKADSPPGDEEDGSIRPFTKFDANYGVVPKHRFPVHLNPFVETLMYNVTTDLIMETLSSHEVEFKAECAGKIVGKSEKLDVIHDRVSVGGS